MSMAAAVGLSDHAAYGGKTRRRTEVPRDPTMRGRIAKQICGCRRVTVTAIEEI
jgi:hypothetical protein